MSITGAGYIPIVTVIETEKQTGKTFVNLQIRVGNKYVKFDPVHWDDLVRSGNIIQQAALTRRDELVDQARDLYEDEEY
jgi:hypothetical protein